MELRWRGQFKSSWICEPQGSEPSTSHVDTKIQFMQACSKEPGQRILKVHGDKQQIEDGTTNCWH